MKPLIAFAVALALVGCTRTAPQGRKEEPKSAPALIPMEEVAQKNVGLRIAPATATEIVEYLQVTGTVQPADNRVAQVRSIARARVIDVLARVGDRVRAGQALAHVDNLEAADVQAQLAVAKAELQRLDVLSRAQARQLERNERLSVIGAAPRKDFEQAQAEYQALEENVRAQRAVVDRLAARLRRLGAAGNATSATTAIVAPFAGVVTKASTAPGALVEASAEMFSVVDMSVVWVQAEVYEKDLGRLRVGQSAGVRVDTYPDEEFTARVGYIGDALDPQTRTAKVRCELPNTDHRLKLDMFATVQLPTTFHKRAVAVPVAALQQLDNRSVVFVQHATTQFEARTVQTGRTVAGDVEIINGLREGERIVVAGSFHLKSIVAGRELGEE